MVSGFKQLMLSLFSELKTSLQQDVKKFCSPSKEEAQLWSPALSHLFLQPPGIRMGLTKPALLAFALIYTV